MFTLVSKQHFFNMVSAVFYVLHVFLETPRLLQFATDAAISGARPRAAIV